MASSAGSFAVGKHAIYGAPWCDHCRMNPRDSGKHAHYRLFTLGEKHVDLCQEHYLAALQVMAAALENEPG